MTQVIWSPSALADLREIRSYIDQFNPKAARNTAQQLIVAGNSLVSFPHRGRPVGDNLRELTTVYPYIIRYEITHDRVFILRIRHGKQQG